MARPSSRNLTTVLVDAENVRRSVWPNIPADDLVELVRDWAEREQVRAVVVFDGSEAIEEQCADVLVVRTGDETADDWIACQASRFSPYWLVTSDRELRERARSAERTIGGGRFARELRQTGELPSVNP